MPTEIVSQIPENVKNAGGISPYPMTNVIESVRKDTGAIRGDIPLMMLQYWAQGVEHRALLEHNEVLAVRDKLEKSNSENTRLAVANAELKKDVQHKDSDKDARTAFVAIGGIGLGVTVPMAIAGPTSGSIMGVAAFVAVFACGLFYPKRK